MSDEEYEYKEPEREELAQEEIAQEQEIDPAMEVTDVSLSAQNLGNRHNELAAREMADRMHDASHAAIDAHALEARITADQEIKPSEEMEVEHFSERQMVEFHKTRQLLRLLDPNSPLRPRAEAMLADLKKQAFKARHMDNIYDAKPENKNQTEQQTHKQEQDSTSIAPDNREYSGNPLLDINALRGLGNKTKTWTNPNKDKEKTSEKQPFSEEVFNRLMQVKKEKQAM